MGCEDGEHKAWLIVEMDSKEQVRQIIPPFYRARTKITKLFQVTREDVDLYKKEHRIEKTDHLHT
jgi:hypothetical protein